MMNQGYPNNLNTCYLISSNFVLIFNTIIFETSKINTRKGNLAMVRKIATANSKSHLTQKSRKF